MTHDNPDTDPQTDPAQRYGILTGWNLPAVLFLCVAFWCVIGAAVAAFYGDWFAFGWAGVAFALAVSAVNDRRWK